MLQHKSQWIWQYSEDYFLIGIWFYVSLQKILKALERLVWCQWQIRKNHWPRQAKLAITIDSILHLPSVKMLFTQVQNWTLIGEQLGDNKCSQDGPKILSQKTFTLSLSVQVWQMAANPCCIILCNRREPILDCTRDAWTVIYIKSSL